VIVSGSLEGDFKHLVADMKEIGLIPVIAKPKEPGSDYTISVIRKRKSKGFGIWVNIVLLIATLISTIYVGEQLYAGYFNITKFSWFLYVDGFIYFSAPLLFILGSHELGHYFVARRNGVAASLPFFIPAPTILGTLGAFISLRDPLPDRKTLIKVGAAGPLVGFVMSIVVAIIGAYLGTVQKPVAVTSSQVSYQISLPIIYSLIPPILAKNVHPVAFAAWVGFLVTAINLFPIGQLDGGHIARGLMGNNARYFSYAFIVILVILGIYDISWILFAVIIIILGLSHPPPLNDVSKPGKKEMMVGVVAIALVLLCFSPQPIVEHIAPNNVSVTLSGGNYFIIPTIANYSTDNLMLTVNNQNSYSVSLSVDVKGPAVLSYTPPINENFSSSEVKEIPVAVWTNDTTVRGNYNFSVKVTVLTRTFNFERSISVVDLDRNLTGNGVNPCITTSKNLTIILNNTGAEQNLTVYQFNQSSVFHLTAQTFSSSGNSTLLSIPGNSDITLNVSFSNPGVASGIVLVNDRWDAFIIFYIPSAQQVLNLLGQD